MTNLDRPVPARLGLDIYSLRSQSWTPLEHLDFAARHAVKVVHFSEIRLIGGLAPDHLRRIRDRADELGIDLEMGMRSICPGSTIFDATAGTAAEQLTAVIEAARIVRSPIVRCVLGRFADRHTPGGIEARMAETVQVLKSVRSRVVDAGLRLALENHAGDMQARELKMVVEDAGPDFVGVCIDSGNALWAIEDPHLVLETLAPYVLTSHVRDGVAWNVPEGAAVTWTRMGEGSLKIDEFIRSYVRKCPGSAVSLEVIVTDEPRIMPYREPSFWEAYRSMPAWEFTRFATLADRGSPRTRPPLRSGETAADREREDVEASLEWTRGLLATLEA